MQKISAVVITFNEERNIERCLASLQHVVDEIIVVDSFSTDHTAEICKKFNVKLFNRTWDDFSASKNFGNEQASHDWILSLDADEALSTELGGNIIDLKNKNTAGSYKINRMTNYCGTWIRHGGWFPDIKVRMFDRRKVKWTGVIHETLSNIAYNTAPLLEGICYHYSYYSKEQHILQAQKYTDIAAMELFEKGERPMPLKIFFSPVAKFIRDYILRLGILDGAAGFTIAWISAKATYWKYKKLKLLYKVNDKA